MQMKFSWSEEKAATVLAKHGIEFLDMTRLWDGPRLVARSDQNGETRWKAIGILEGRFFAVIYTERGDTIRLITARRARDNEERAYRDLYG
jgi:uncharacterized DUF497 family protein